MGRHHQLRGIVAKTKTKWKGSPHIVWKSQTTAAKVATELRIYLEDPLKKKSDKNSQIQRLR